MEDLVACSLSLSLSLCISLSIYHYKNNIPCAYVVLICKTLGRDGTNLRG